MSFVGYGMIWLVVIFLLGSAYKGKCMVNPPPDINLMIGANLVMVALLLIGSFLVAISKC